MNRPFRQLTLAGAALFLAASSVFAAETYVIDKDHSETSFQVQHMLGKVRGVFADFGGTIAFDKANPVASTVEFRIKATSIDTNNERRDGHLRSPDFFDVATYPEIAFTSTKVTPKGGNAFDVTGTLTMRGVTKTVTLPVRYLGEAADPSGRIKASFETAVTLNRKDYNIVWNKALDTGGFVLGDDVAVTINLQAERKVSAPATN
jgi:polyisoprenoid-binding protein YceI